MQQKIILCILFTASTLFPQLSRSSVSGYLETEGDYFVVTDDYYFGYNKFRINFESELNENVSIYSSLIGMQYWGRNYIAVTDIIPVPELSGALFQLADTLHFDQLYGVIRASFGEFVIGRQPVSLGTGYMWNPLDIYNIKNMLDPTYELPGLTAFRCYIPSLLGEFDMIAAPVNNGKDWNYSLSLTQYLAGFDVTLAWANRYYPVILYDIMEADGITTLYKYRQGPGLSFTGELFGMGIWGEMLYYSKDTYLEDNKMEWVWGVDYTTESSLYILLERYHNDFGGDIVDLGTGTKYDFFDVNMYLSRISRTLAKDYITLFMMYPAGDYSSLEYWMLKNLTDDSWLQAVQSNISLFEDVNLLITIYKGNGGNTTEFGLQEMGARIRFDFYF